MSHFASGPPWNRALLRTKSHKLAPVIAPDAVGDTNGIMDAPSREKVTQKDAVAGWERSLPGFLQRGVFRSRAGAPARICWSGPGLDSMISYSGWKRSRVEREHGSAPDVTAFELLPSTRMKSSD